MAEPSPPPLDNQPPERDYTKDSNYYYTVLNLHKEASPAEIHERHRALSLVYHPDKQYDDRLKDVSTKTFLEVQKAYQVLSDPFLRQVYDTLGPEGLAVQWPPQLRSRTKEEIEKILKNNEIAIRRKAITSFFLPQAVASCSIDATGLFAPGRSPNLFKARHELEYNLEVCRPLVFKPDSTKLIGSVTFFDVKRRISTPTSLALGAKFTSQSKHQPIRYFGTVRHQFSPRLASKLSVDFLSPYTTTLHVNYNGPDHSMEAKAVFLPLKLHVVAPLITVSIKRRLFRRQPQRGILALQMGHNPSIAFFYHTPTILNGDTEGRSSGHDHGHQRHQQGPLLQSTRGLRFIVLERAYGIAFDTILPKLVAEVSVSLTELSTRLRASIHYGLAGAFLILSGQWSNETTELAATVSTGTTGVTVTFECQYLEQRLSLPITLSTEVSPGLAFGAIVLPSSLLFVAYRFVVIPRRRAQRKLAIQAMKQELEEGASEAMHEYRAAQSLMKDSVKRQRKLESSRDGLIIQEGWYGVMDRDDSGEEVFLDVTDALQAIVRNSQLFIPGGETKAALQGFSDPAPFAAKMLRLRYSFRGRGHYAEIPDYAPVVLPLREHQIEEQT